MPTDNVLRECQLTFEDQAEYTMLDMTLFFAFFSNIYRLLERSMFLVAKEPEWEQAAAIWMRELGFFNRSNRLTTAPELHPMSYIFTSDSVREGIKRGEALRIVSMRKASPFELVLFGLGGPLVLVVIISGGKIQFSEGKLNCQLPPIGKGIEYLRKALSSKLARTEIPTTRPSAPTITNIRRVPPSLPAAQSQEARRRARRRAKRNKAKKKET